MKSEPKVGGIAYLLAKKGMSRKQAKEAIRTPNIQEVTERLRTDESWNKVKPTKSENTTLGRAESDELYGGKVYDKFKYERRKREVKLRKAIDNQEKNKSLDKKRAQVTKTLQQVYSDRKKSGDASTTQCVNGDSNCEQKGSSVPSYKSVVPKNYNYKTYKKNLGKDIRVVRRGTASNASPREEAMKDRVLDRRQGYATQKEINTQKAFGYSLKRAERLSNKKR
jgi:hypothetical protein